VPAVGEANVEIAHPQRQSLRLRRGVPRRSECLKSASRCTSRKQIETALFDKISEEKLGQIKFKVKARA
jgi:hypothetical protein